MMKLVAAIVGFLSIVINAETDDHSSNEESQDLHSGIFPFWTIYPSSVIAGFGLILNLLSLFYFVKRWSYDRDLGELPFDTVICLAASAIFKLACIY